MPLQLSDPWWMQDFLCNQPQSVPVPGKKRNGRQVYRLCTDFVVHLKNFGHIVVPAGFEWDGASVPRLFWRLFPARDASDPAAALHDWLTATERHTRRQVDFAFRRVLDLVDMSNWRRMAMYQAVDKFSWLTWRQHTHASVQAARDLAPWEVWPALRSDLKQV